jgi:hypothetical protein
MNERIKHLWEQAINNDDTWAGQVKFLENFSESIVKECAGIAEISMPINSHPDDRLTVKNSVLAHFGIEL